MDDIRKIWIEVVISALAIGILIRPMMAEFDYNGLSYLSVVLGFGAVGCLQLLSTYISEKMREMPQPIRYW